MKSIAGLWCAVLLLNGFGHGANGRRRTKFQSRTQAGRCEPYRGTFCSQYHKGQMVYVKRSQEEVEGKVKTITGILNNHVTNRCKKYVMPTLCNYSLPPCDKTSKKPKPRRFCRDDCYVLQNDVCKLEFQEARKRFTRLLPDCSVLPAPGSPDYKSCIRVTMKAVTFTARVSNITMYEGMSVTLKCRLSRKRIPFNITWLKNGQPISARYRTSKMKWGSRMKMGRARVGDAGKYECIVRAMGQEVRAVGWLDIRGVAPRPTKNTGKKEKVTKPTLKPTKKTKTGSKRYPRCETYRGKACSGFISGRTIYSEHRRYQNHIERMLSTPLKALSLSDSMSHKCRKYGIPALCYHNFKTCDRKTSQMKERLCREDCYALYDDICATELKLALKDPFLRNLLPNCSQLPMEGSDGHAFCSPLKLPDKVSSKKYPRCEPYRGKTCYDFIAGKSIFADNHRHQADIEMRLSGPLKAIRAAESMNPKCRQYGIPALCYHIFNTCDPDSVEPKYRLCRKDCYALYEDVCAVELSVARNDPTIKDLLPNCSLLPAEGTKDHGFCSPLKIPGYTDTNTLEDGGSKSHLLMNIAYLNNSKDENCYNGTGHHYIGRQNVTKYGMACLSWHLHDAVYKLSHNYCRNPRGQQESPWCYVGKNVYEYCVIPKCSEGPKRALLDTPSVIPVGRTIYVISAIMAVLIVAFVSIIVYLKVQHRRSTLPNRDHSSSGSISKSTQSTMQQPSSDFKQSLVDVKSCVFTEIDDSNQGKVKFLELIGEGGFAKVCKAALMKNENEYSDIHMAIKRLKPNVPRQVVENFRNEISVLANLQDINLLCLVGVSGGEEPLFMVFEYYDDMDLHRYLNLHIPAPLRPEIGDEGDPDEILLLDFALQVASGMAFLADNNFIHRDLAARNCFVTEDNIVKISNLGIGSCRYPADYSWVHGSSLLPVRWMAPEALNSLQFTYRSDIWSFGVVLWEIYSYGRQPYSGHTNQEAIECIRNMQILPCPDGCPARMYALMKECFEESSWERPKFSDICAELREWAGDSIGDNH